MGVVFGAEHRRVEYDLCQTRVKAEVEVEIEMGLEVEVEVEIAVREKLLRPASRGIKMQDRVLWWPDMVVQANLGIVSLMGDQGLCKGRQYYSILVGHPDMGQESSKT